MDGSMPYEEPLEQGLRTPTSAGRSRCEYSDRLIPSRLATNLEGGFDLLGCENARPLNGGGGGGEGSNGPAHDARDENSAAYNQLLRSELLGIPSPPRWPDKEVPKTPDRKLFHYMSSPEKTVESPDSLSPVPWNTDLVETVRKPTRKISSSPYRVLDASGMQDDFYLNLIDWGTGSALAVGLGSRVHLWSPSTCRARQLCDLGCDNAVTSVNWSQGGTALAVGTRQGEVAIWDVEREQRLRTMDGHRRRVAALAWNGCVLSSGSMDHTILHRDVRQRRHAIARLKAHRQEVCGLKWSVDMQQLASGGNDNCVCVWNMRSTVATSRFSEHRAAVKAIAWSPHRSSLLASGGGSADKCIRIWNTANNSALSCVDTGSQVCNLVWSRSVNEIASTHGYSLNEIVLWRYPSMTKVVTLTGHRYRVLYMTLSRDGRTIVTGDADETLRFWEVFPGARAVASVSAAGTGGLPGASVAAGGSPGDARRLSFGTIR